MRKIILCLILILLAVPVGATVLVSENWDSGTPPSGWPCLNIPGSCTTSAFNDWYPRNFDCSVTGGQQSGLSTTQAHSGTKSYYQYRASGANYACDISHTFTDQTKVYVSFYIYFPSSVWNSWTLNNTEQGDDQGHFFFMNSGVRGANRIVVDICDAANGTWPGQCWSSGTNAAYFKYYLGGEDTQFSSSAAYCWNIITHTDAWHKITWMFDRVNDKFAMWIDGTQVVGTGGNGVTQDYNATDGDTTSFTKWIYSAYRSSNTGVVQAYYLDDVIIATALSDVEGDEADTTAPSTTISTSDPSSISTDALIVTGTASDAVGVSGCKWRKSSAPDASNGTACTGTTTFSCSTSGYTSGSNTMYVGCYDAAGNYGSDSITVNYSPIAYQRTGVKGSGGVWK